jgi:hypothetical protein
MEEVCTFPVIFKHMYPISWQNYRMSLNITAVTEVLWQRKQASLKMQSVFATPFNTTYFREEF